MNCYLVVREHTPWCDGCNKEQEHQKDILGAFETRDGARAAVLATKPLSPDRDVWLEMHPDNDPFPDHNTVEAWSVAEDEDGWRGEFIYVRSIELEAGPR